MGKLDVGVGDEFPVDEPAPPSPDEQDAARAAREEWERQKEEWRRRKQEWRAHRDAWHEEMRARREAFKSDLRKNIRENFGGGFTGRGASNPFLLRVLIVMGALALAVVLLPLLFLAGFVLVIAALLFIGARSGHNSYSASGSGAPSQK